MNKNLNDIAIELKWKKGKAIKHKYLDKFIRLTKADSNILNLVDPEKEVKYFLWRNNEKNYIVTNDKTINTLFLKTYCNPFWISLGRPELVFFHSEKNNNNGLFTLNKKIKKQTNIISYRKTCPSFSYKDILQKNIPKKKEIEETKDDGIKEDEIKKEFEKNHKIKEMNQMIKNIEEMRNEIEKLKNDIKRFMGIKVEEPIEETKEELIEEIKEELIEETKEELIEETKEELIEITKEYLDTLNEMKLWKLARSLKVKTIDIPWHVDDEEYLDILQSMIMNKID